MGVSYIAAKVNYIESGSQGAFRATRKQLRYAPAHELKVLALICISPHMYICTLILRMHRLNRERSKNKAAAIAKGTGVKQGYTLMKPPYHNRITPTVPDYAYCKECY